MTIAILACMRPVPCLFVSLSPPAFDMTFACVFTQTIGVRVCVTSADLYWTPPHDLTTQLHDCDVRVGTVDASRQGRVWCVNTNLLPNKVHKRLAAAVSSSLCMRSLSGQRAIGYVEMPAQRAAPPLISVCSCCGAPNAAVAWGDIATRLPYTAQSWVLPLTRTASCSCIGITREVLP